MTPTGWKCIKRSSDFRPPWVRVKNIAVAKSALGLQSQVRLAVTQPVVRFAALIACFTARRWLVVG